MKKQSRPLPYNSRPREALFPFEALRIFIAGDVRSLKNGKRVVGTSAKKDTNANSWGNYLANRGGPVQPAAKKGSVRVLPSMAYMSWESAAIPQMQLHAAAFHNTINRLNLKPPYFVGMRFVCETNRKFDWHSMAESVADAGTKAGLWEDDNIWELAAVYLPPLKDKAHPGVDLILFSEYPLLFSPLEFEPNRPLKR